MLPNGMQFHVHAAESARRHDSWILQNSGVVQKLRDLQEFSEQKYRIHGDPAYGADPPFLSSTGLGPVRVTIEQDFGETKDDFKIVNWARFLQLRKMKVAMIFFVALFLHDLYITLNGSKVSTEFGVAPPTIEEWTHQGPKKENNLDDWLGLFGDEEQEAEQQQQEQEQGHEEEDDSNR
jgi:hypothetical protein